MWERVGNGSNSLHVRGGMRQIGRENFSIRDGSNTEKLQNESHSMRGGERGGGGGS